MVDRPELPTRAARWLALDPETWRADLLRVILRVTAGLGSVVYVPSLFLAIRHDMAGVAILDTVAITAILGLSFTTALSVRTRATATCLVFYGLGVGLMLGVGSIAQIYLFGFSILTTLLLGFRPGILTAALNAATLFTLGMVSLTAPELAIPGWGYNAGGWAAITLNFALVNMSMVLALGALISALEAALARAIEGRELLRIAGLTARLGGWRLDVRSGTVSWSDEVCDLYGFPPGTSPPADHAIGEPVPECRERMRQVLDECARDGAPFDLECEVLDARGSPLWVRCIGRAGRSATGAVTHVYGSVQDVTARRVAEAEQERLEGELRHAQKLEVLGSLAGGVAHDFNNLLSVVLSYTDLILADLPAADPLRQDLGEIRQAGLRATELTRQLLAFGRKQLRKPVILDLTQVVAGVERMLGRLAGEGVRLAVLRGPDDARVHADAGQLEQVLVNLAVNARDAMPQGGALTIEIALADLDAASAAGIPPGSWVLLTVTDTGTGMDAATQARIFEPFFTTKARGEGTGLGLSTVYGIVRQGGGHVRVRSASGAGTTFEIWLPRTDLAVEPAAPAIGPASSVRGTETILLVESELPVRAVIRAILHRHGYRVLDVENPSEALLVCEQLEQPIHLLLTDVVMPRMSGPKLAERLASIRPDMAVLFVSGYAEDAIVHHGTVDPGVELLAKPIVPEALVRRVRQVLDQRAVTARAPREPAG